MNQTELNELDLFLKDCFESLKNNNSGKVADYIPYLSKIPSSKFAISLCTIDGKVINIGDTKEQFCSVNLQPFSYCYARKLLEEKRFILTWDMNQQV